MKNRKLLLIVSLVLALTMSLGGTLAYLTDTDADVNTMVLGNVKIVQNEQEWNANETQFQEFTQDKPLLPYVGTMGWENTEEDGGAYRRFTMNNVVDKYVTVTNTGNTDAYVRTIIALEMGGYTYEEFKMIGVSVNAANGSEFKFPGAWMWTNDYAAQIDGKNYNIMVAEHQDPLAAEETTIPSLLQVYLSKDADNEDVAKLDGNGNGKYDILVISQAVQADGFADANTALNEAFGKVTANERETVAAWFASINKDGSDYQVGSPDGGKNDTNLPPELPIVKVSDLAGLKDALEDVSKTGEPVTIDAQDKDLGDMDNVTFPDGVVIKNATFTGDASHGSYGNNANGTVTFVNCTFTSNYAYAAHFDGGNGELVFIDCDFEGWNSFGTAITDLTFQNCTFGHNGNFGLVRAYQNASFTNCVFADNLEGVDVSESAPEGTVVAFENCTGITVDKIKYNSDKSGNNAKGKAKFILDGVDVSADVGVW